jgi:acetolactate synthase-1/3 small subunit
MSLFTVTVKGNKLAVEKIEKQLYKIIEVIKVQEKTDDQLIVREVALIKVGLKNKEQRKEIENFAILFHANIAYVDEHVLVIEKSGTEEEIESLYTRMKPFGIKEYVRSGRIALIKEVNK